MIVYLETILSQLCFIGMNKNPSSYWHPGPHCFVVVTSRGVFSLFVQSSSSQPSSVSTRVTAAALELRQGAELELPYFITVSGAVSTLPCSAAGQYIAPLPAGGAWPPHAVMLSCGLPCSPMNTSDQARLETMATARGSALRPRTYPPLKSASISRAVLHRDGPL